MILKWLEEKWNVVVVVQRRPNEFFHEHEFNTLVDLDEKYARLLVTVYDARELGGEFGRG